MDPSEPALTRPRTAARTWWHPIAAGVAAIYALALVSPISKVCPLSYPSTCSPETRASVALQSAVILLFVLATGLLVIALIGRARRDRSSRWVTGVIVATGLVLVGWTVLFAGFGWSPIPRLDGSVAVPLSLTAASAVIAGIGWLMDKRIQAASPEMSRAVLRIGVVLLAASGLWLLLWSTFFIQPL